ncbi:MAG TPA: hypothetical protein VM286_03610 [Candidatus Thermoplasmatota archaeon]|nr:hypothetical protein [Candidatus Thermoplasmatota archaeon]
MRFVAVSLAILLLSGCATPFSGASTSAPVTAKQNVGAAREIAHAWDGASVLTSVFAMEVHDAVKARADLADEQDQPLLNALLNADDPAVGDGRAASWGYVFRNGPDALLLVLEGAGHELYRNQTKLSGDALALPDWQIDSDNAMQLARHSNATFESHVLEAQSVSLEMGTRNGSPVWHIRLTKDLQTEKVLDRAIVGAMNGTVEVASNGIVEYPQEKGRVTANLNAAQPDGSAEFEVKAPHDRLFLAVTTQTLGAANTATVTVKGPDGQETKLEAVGTTPSVPPGSGSAPPKANLTLPLLGKYTVTFHLSGGAAFSPRLDWCTDGKPAPATGGGRGGGGSNAACPS